MVGMNVIAIRKLEICRKLKKCGALTAETAKTLEEAGVNRPDKETFALELLLKKGNIARVDDNKYYLVKDLA